MPFQHLIVNALLALGIGAWSCAGPTVLEVCPAQTYERTLRVGHVPGHLDPVWIIECA